MKSKKATRRALLSSLLSLLLCCSMLLGTTFAWFTDSVTSTGNIIKSGTLDVEMTWADTNSANEADWKDASAGAIFDYKFWEPGYTQIKYVKIENVGDLAFKYQLNILPDSAVTGQFNLADVIEAYLMPVTAGQTIDRDTVDAFMAANTGATLAQLMADPDGAAYGTMLPAEGKGAQSLSSITDAVRGSVTYCVVLHMQEEATNDYQNLSVGNGFSVQLLATQLTAEIDSFGPDYDFESEYDEVYVPTTASGSTGVSELGSKVNADKTLAEDVTLGNAATGTATFAKGTKLADDATELSFKVNGVGEAHADTTVAADEDVIPLNIEVAGLAEDNTKPVTITYQTIKGLNGVTVYHNGVAMTQSADGLTVNTYYYDNATGIITITSASFSPFDLVFTGYSFMTPGKDQVFYSLDEIITAGAAAVMVEDVNIESGTGPALTVPSGASVELDLNGHTLSYASTADSGNQELFLVKGTLSLSNGKVVAEHTGANMGWSAMTTIFDVTAGGVLNLSKVTAENLGGTDMNFVVHMNNWGEVTLNADNCVLVAPYCVVRVFNSGYDMNNVNITNSTLSTSGNRALWVHNYIGDLDSSKHSDAAVKARLKINIFDGTNTFTADRVDVVRYGFGSSVSFDRDGNEIAVVSTSEALEGALKSGATVYLNEGEYTLPTLAGYEGITIVGGEGTVIGGESAKTGFGNNFGKNTTIKNVTFSGTTNGVRWSYAEGGETTFENCTFAGDSTYGFHIDQSNGAAFTFNNCTFSGFNAFAGDLEKIIFNNCTFLSNGNYGHTNIHSTAYFNNCTWGDNTSVSPAKSTAKTYFNGVEESYHHEFIGSAESLFDFAKSVNEGNDSWSGQKVLLVADIDLNNAEWTPIGQTGATEFRGIFDGQNHTIYNLYVDSSKQTGEHYSSGLFGWAERAVTIQNVKVDGASVTGNHNVAVIVGYTYSGKISNCHVTNAKIVCTHANDDACGDKCGLIAGYAADESRITDCSGKSSTVTAGRDAGQLIGCGYNVSVSNCSASDVTVSATGDCTGNNINKTLIGRVMG